MANAAEIFDIGIITDLIPGKYTESKQDEIYMSFDGNEVIYPRNEWNKITLAYAMSIHKSQGSEFPVVILPITRQSGRMLQRNLIYTAITRAKNMRPIRPSSSIWKPAVCSAVSELTRAKKGSFPDRRSPFFYMGCLDSKNRCGTSLGYRSGCRTLYLLFQGGKVMYENQSN